MTVRPYPPAPHLPFPNRPALHRGIIDANELKVYRKIDELNTAMSGASGGNTVMRRQGVYGSFHEGIPDDKLERLEQMMQSMKGSGGPNPEMQELNGVLDKLITVQHPERLKDTPELPLPEGLSAVKAETGEPDISFISKEGASAVGVGFYGLTGELSGQKGQAAISAFIPETQTVMNGSTVRLQLAQTVQVSGVTLPAGTNLYGLASFKNERLQVIVRSLQSEGQIIAVNLKAYDEDGQEGIYMPGSVTRDMAKQSADQSINGLGVGSMDASLGAQAGVAGIQLAKNLLSRKVKVIRVIVKGGYRVWLKDNSKH